MQKIFRTIDEQTEILKEKGLIIEDEYEVKDILLRENYFFLTGYRHLFLKEPKSRYFKENATFKELYSLFNFDRQLRNIFFKNILIIENNLKSIFSYELSMSYGYKEKDYLKPTNFNTSKDKARQVNDLLKKIKRQIRINGGQHSATTHYIYNYGYVPLWVVVKVLSFGIVCELYSIMKTNNQKSIADTFKINTEEMSSYLPILANYRNLCAHEDILFDHRTATSIPKSIYHDKLGIELFEDEYTSGKNDLFALVLIMKKMLRKDDFTMLMRELEYEIELLESKISSIKIDTVLSKMGFPKNYIDLIEM